MSPKKLLDSSVLTATVIGSLVALNLIGLALFGRLDLTGDKQFTLSAATKQTLKGLSDPVTVRAYFTKDLPPPYSTNARYVRDLLEEYFAVAGGNLKFEFVDPTSEETEQDKEKKKEVSQDIFGRTVREETSVEKDLRTLGIPPVQVRVNEGDKLEVKRAYMGIAIRLGDKKEVIPVVSEPSTLEYDLTTMIRKVSQAKAPKIAFLGGHESPEPHKAFPRLAGLIGQLYEVTTLDLTQKAEIPDDVTAIVAIAPKTPYAEAEQRAIDKFVMSGRAAAFLLGPVAPDLKTLSTTPLSHGLDGLLSTWGVKLTPGLVLDPECATLNVAQQRGFMQITQPVRYPYVLLPKALDPKHALTRGLAGAAFPFSGALELTAPEGVKAEAIVKSSSGAWVQTEPYNLDPFQRWTRDLVKDPSEKVLIATVAGPLKSHFATEAVSSDPAQRNQAENARVLVSAGHSFLLDEFMSKGNEALLLNLMDWLAQDEALLAVRSRGLAAAPLDDKIGDGKRNGLKIANVVGLPLVLVGFGLVRWRLREARRAKATL